MSENERKAEVVLESVEFDWDRELATVSFKISDYLTDLTTIFPLSITISKSRTVNFVVHDAFLDLTRILRELAEDCQHHKGPYRGYFIEKE